MLKINKCLMALVVLLVFPACSVQQVSYDYDQSIDFVAFKSYQWQDSKAVATPDPRVHNDLMAARIKRSVDRVLARKNYVKGNGDTDFAITYQISIEKRTEADRFKTGVGFGFTHWDVGFHSDTVVREYDLVTIYIDIIDPKTDKLIWRGIREYRYFNGGSVADKDAFTENIVSEILGGFPP